jgi:Winged helix-turn-helix DNA-binding
MADLLDTIRADLDARITELRPLVQEAASLEAALVALQNPNQGPSASRGSTRARRQTAGRGRSRSARAQRQTAPAGPTRATRGQTRQQVIDYVRGNPGSTAGDVATALGLNRNSVATRLAQLAKAGELSKAARGYAAP